MAHAADLSLNHLNVFYKILVIFEDANEEVINFLLKENKHYIA